MAKEGTAPTMKDVALEAGVSLGTVSKVVNGLPVGRSYQKKVEAAVRKLDYRVNSYAKGLKTSRTYTVAFLVPDLFNSFFALLCHHINVALTRRGYKMLLCCTNSSPEMEQTLLDMAQQNKVDAIISISYTASPRVQDGTPIVTIDRRLDGGIPCIASDNFAGGQIAARRLQELGCTSLAYMGNSSSLPNEATKRRDGFLSACMETGVAHTLFSLTDSPEFPPFAAFLDQHIHGEAFDFDGVFCVDDALACHVVQHLRGRGIRVPEQVQVIGFDGITQFANGQPVCSTLVQPVEKIAQAAVDIALGDQLASAPPLVLLTAEYAPGGTTRE